LNKSNFRKVSDFQKIRECLRKITFYAKIFDFQKFSRIFKKSRNATGCGRMRPDAAGRSRTWLDAAGRGRTQPDAAGRGRMRPDAAGCARMPGLGKHLA
jgi:hypothetical protein